MMCQALLRSIEEASGDSFSSLRRVYILNSAGRMAFYTRAKEIKIIKEMKPMKRVGACWPLLLISGLRNRSLKYVNLFFYCSGKECGCDSHTDLQVLSPTTGHLIFLRFGFFLYIMGIGPHFTEMGTK